MSSTKDTAADPIDNGFGVILAKSGRSNGIVRPDISDPEWTVSLEE